MIKISQILQGVCKPINCMFPHADFDLNFTNGVLRLK